MKIRSWFVTTHYIIVRVPLAPMVDNGIGDKEICDMWQTHYKQLLNPIRSGLFQTANDPGGGGFKSPPPPLRSRKQLCQSSPYHTCAFYQVF